MSAVFVLAGAFAGIARDMGAFAILSIMIDYPR